MERLSLPSTRPSIVGSSLTQITDAEFEAFRKLIYADAGISLSPAKRALVCSRLAKRLRQLGMKTYGEYYEFLLSEEPGSPERQEMINCITTNKTEFFRESHHFDFLRDTAFPQIRERARRGGPRRLRIWSAGCSTGEEPYTLAITLLEHFGPLSGWDVRILASDIDTQVLKKAEEGIYSLDSIRNLPEEIRRKYFLRGTGTLDGTCRVRPDLQSLITFRRINFMDDVWPIRTNFDLIFCRNVLIYFNRETQERLVSRFAQLLDPNGHLMLGHSENVSWLTDLLMPLGGTIHKLRSAPRAPRFTPFVKPESQPRPAPVNRLAIRSAVPPKASTAVATETLPHRSIIVGEVFASKEPMVVSTILGSCIAVCLYDPETEIGGMNHFLLPGTPDNGSTSTRYGENAMRVLIEKVVQLGASRHRLRAKVFGGALPEISPRIPPVGQQNVTFIEDLLAREQIPVEARRVGGLDAVRVEFFTHTGRARVQALDPSVLPELVERVNGDVESLAVSDTPKASLLSPA